MGKKAVAAAIVILLFGSSYGSAQSNDEGLAFLQFNFLNPGARALGMGGAFVALADDATAALANPAGLTILLHPEVSLEYASTNYINKIPWYQATEIRSFSRNGAITREFNFEYTLHSRNFPDTQNNISFASFVYPVVKNKFVVSAQYNEQTKFERNFSTLAAPIYIRQPQGPPTKSDELAPTEHSLSLSIKNIGFSGSWKANRFFSFGGTVTYSRIDLEKLSIRNPEQVTVRDTLTSHDGDVGFTGGILYSPMESLSFGAVYSRRATFDTVATNAYPFFQIPPDTIPHTTFKVPDSFAVGASFKPTKKLRANIDAVRVFYSQLMDSYYNVALNRNIPGEDNPQVVDPVFGKTALEVADGTEIRAGGEYVLFLGNYPFSLRTGYWFEPFHSIIHTMDDADLVVIRDNGDVQNDVLGLAFHSRSIRENNHHVAAGAGIVLKSFTIDWAYDYSRNFKRFLISTVIYPDKF